MPLLVKNGEIITADSRYKADIYCEDETITLQRCFDGAQCSGTTCSDGRCQPREYHGSSKRKDRKGLPLGHWF
jgi:hypothetical protein